MNGWIQVNLQEVPEEQIDPLIESIKQNLAGLIPNMGHTGGIRVLIGRSMRRKS